MSVRKAVIPAAGFGTRLLPASKAEPKELLAVVDKPAIQYVVEEAARAGIQDVLVVTSRGKGGIEDHFDRAPELEDALEKKGDDAKLRAVREVAPGVQLHFVRQPSALGLGDAVLQAERHVGDEPFAVLLPDDLFEPEESLLEDLIAVSERHGASVVTGMEVTPEEIARYGAIAAAPEPVDDRVLRVTDLVEKPDPAEAPSNLAIFGRYVFRPEIFAAIRATQPGAGGEIQLTDGVRRLARERPGAVLAIRFTGTRYDVGDKAGYLRTTVQLGARHPELGPAFVEFLGEFVAAQAPSG